MRYFIIPIAFLFNTIVVNAQNIQTEFIRIDSFLNGGTKYSKEYFTLDSIKHKREVYFQNGQINVEINYKDGIEHGMQKLWFESGVLMDSQYMENGKTSGIWKHWYESRKIRTIGELNRNAGRLTNYYESGQIESIEHQDSLLGLTDEAIYYYSNGQLSGKINYSNPIQLFEKFYSNGNKLDSGIIVRALFPIDEWKSWHENGQLKSIGNYKHHGSEVASFKEANKKFGEWKYYDESGKFYLKETYNDIGVLISSEKIEE